MPQSREYSIEEVLNFTVKDIQGPNFVDVKIKGWLRLMSEQREQCIMKLRDLVRQRDKMTKSIAVDANDLKNRLHRVERSRSHTPILPPYDPNDPEELEIKIDREAYEALVDDKCQPCYPIELGFEVFKNPGQYKDIFEYWRGECGVHFRSLLMFAPHRFPEFQQQVIERWRRHGLDGDVQLLEDQNKQSKLDDWIEYQDYELREYECLEKKFEEVQARLVFRRKALAEAGISAFEEIQELEFASYYSLALQCSGEEGKAKKKEELAERKLRLAEKRLKAAESDDLGEMVKRTTWIALFLKEVKSLQLRLDELQRLAENAKRELEPFETRFQVRQIEWAEERLKDPVETGQLIEKKALSTEDQDLLKKLNELSTKAHEAGMAHFKAEKEVEFAEEGYKAAQEDNLGETVERAALIQVIQEEVRSAQTQFEQVRESTEKIKLKGQVVSALSSIPFTRGKVKRHIILLKWIEQQRQKIVDDRANSEKEGGQDQSKRASSRALQNRPVIEPSRLNKLPKANGRKRKKRTTRSILSPVDPAKVSKGHSKRRRSTRTSKPPERFRPGFT